jgi:hypothetical protein
MQAEADLSEYLDEIRQEVCSGCVERPPGGPPCGPSGKQCGIELHLPQLVDAIHGVRSDSIVPYLEKNRREVCEQCAFLHSSICPCPMDYLSVLVVQAVEAVDERHRGREGERPVAGPPGGAGAELEEVGRAYEAGTGTWTGCDWPTHFGPTGLNVGGWTAAEAEAVAAEMVGTEEGEVWSAAARWLAGVQISARQAEAQGGLAVAAARAGKWGEALAHAQRAWALEFAAGRPLRRALPPAWLGLYRAVRAANTARGRPEGQGVDVGPDRWAG